MDGYWLLEPENYYLQALAIDPNLRDVCMSVLKYVARKLNNEPFVSSCGGHLAVINAQYVSTYPCLAFHTETPERISDEFECALNMKINEILTETTLSEFLMTITSQME